MNVYYLELIKEHILYESLNCEFVYVKHDTLQ